MVFISALNGLSMMPLIAAASYQSNVSQFVRSALGNETDVVATLQRPREFLAQIAQTDESSLQAMFRFHKRAAADIAWSQIPPGVRQALSKGFFVESVDDRIDDFFAAVVEVMTEGAVQSVRAQSAVSDGLVKGVIRSIMNDETQSPEAIWHEQRRQEVLSAIMTIISRVIGTVEEREQVTLDATYLTLKSADWSGRTRLQFPNSLRHTQVYEFFERLHMSFEVAESAIDPFLKQLEEHFGHDDLPYPWDLVDASADDGWGRDYQAELSDVTLQAYIDAIIAVLEAEGS